VTTRRRQDAIREVDPAQHAVRRPREVQKHLVVIDRQAVLRHELAVELPRDRRMCSKERDPSFELDAATCDLCAHSCPTLAES
jgi:hypothetical protein